MFVDPEKLYKEKALIKEISRLESLMQEDHSERKDTIEYLTRISDTLNDTRAELKLVWEEIRKEQKFHIKQRNSILIGVLVMLILIAISLAYKL